MFNLHEHSKFKEKFQNKQDKNVTNRYNTFGYVVSCWDSYLFRLRNSRAFYTSTLTINGLFVVGVDQKGNTPEESARLLGIQITSEDKCAFDSHKWKHK